MESVIQDVKFGVRLLWKQRGFSSVALATLALGIGATTAIFCVADAALIRPLPYDKPEQLFLLGLVQAARPTSTQASSLEDMDQWRTLAHVFSHVGAASSETKVVVGAEEPESISVTLASLDYLPMYGQSPLLGRAFTTDDERLGAPPVALLGYRYWKSRYQADSSVLGKTISFANGSAMIVGVLGDDEARVQAKIVMPLQATEERRRARQYSVYGRLREGVTVAMAQRETDALLARLDDGSPRYKGYSTRLISQFEMATRTSRPTVNVLVGAVGFVLLIACVNVASLQLARGAVRQTELAIRAAIGAGRRRLIRQLLTESLLLSFAGSVLGTLIAWLVLDVLVANVPIRISSDVTVGLNLRVLGATIALATISGLVFGLMPAIRLSSIGLNALLSHGSRGVRTTLSRAASGILISIEIAAAIVLVTGAALMLRSFARISELPLGFDANHFFTLEAAPIDNRPEVFGPYYASLLHQIRQLPSVESAGGTPDLPLSGNMSFTRVTSKGVAVAVILQETTPGYFEAAGVPLLAGRLPNGPDVGDLSWMVLSERAAKQLFPGESALGGRVKYRDTWRDVIGIVGNVESNGFERPVDAAQLYVAYTGGSGYSTDLTGRASGEALVILVHPRDAGTGLAEVLRQTAKSIGPSVIVRRVRPGHEWWSDNVVRPRQRTVLLGILGGLGLLLALVGVFGVTSFAVSRRVSEIGVRMAFGARPGQVVGTMLKDATLPIAAGIPGGVIGAFYLSKVISTFLYKTAPRDPWAFAAAALLLAVSGLVAAWLPARRAAKVDPVVALRAD